MKKLTIVLLSLVLLLAGCSTTHRVHTDSTKELIQDLKELSPLIEKVRITFTRPNLYYAIEMNQEPSQEELESILAEIEKFSTVERINEIARSVNWNLEISTVHLRISTDENKETNGHSYYARYFKTSNASDYSEQNIEAYRIWHENDPNP
ncbi:hypothetical protein [Saccharibacillus sacchari]|uniref:hypothetical protein n=1 Tax=Saccharibacillus sacchari TaxID=456493 RepID=UPI0004AEF031|nr:hypothetical protein [Saccharibacillus sacchari]